MTTSLAKSAELILFMNMPRSDKGRKRGRYKKRTGINASDAAKAGVAGASGGFLAAGLLPANMPKGLQSAVSKAASRLPKSMGMRSNMTQMIADATMKKSGRLPWMSVPGQAVAAGLAGTTATGLYLGKKIKDKNSKTRRKRF